MKKSPYDHHPKQKTKQRADLTASEIRTLTREFNEKNSYLASVLEQITPKQLYRDLFPEGSFELEGRRGDDQERRPNGIINVIRDTDARGRSYNRILFDDLSELDAVMGKEFVIISPVGYSGRRRLEKFAYKIYGFIIDLDYVQVDNIKDLLFQMENGIIPYASHIINSGTGLHVYYVFDTPVPAFPKYLPSLNKLKERITEYVWNKYTSASKEKQYQGIFQGYRAPGTQTKISEDCLVTAFRAGKPVSINYLNSFVEESEQAIFDDLKYTSLLEAQELWPDWYERRIVQGQPAGSYDLDDKQRKRRRAWYDKWIRTIDPTIKEKQYDGSAYDGNRYYCICILFNLGMKAEIPIKEVEQDALALVPKLNALTKNSKNQFTDEDALAARIYYDRKYIKLGREAIKRMTSIDIGATKRSPQGKRVPRKKDQNGNSNLKASAWGRRDALYPDGSWRNMNGRPKGSGTKEVLVRDYIADHPSDSPSKIAKALGVSRTTVYKYLNSEESNNQAPDEETFEAETFEQRLNRLMKYRDNLV